MSDHIPPMQLDAYHDRELSAPQQDAVARHLSTCAACSAQLAGIQEISQAFAAAPVDRLSQISLQRLHTNLDLLTDRGLFQIARVLSAIAACVLLAGSVWLLRSNHAPAPISSPVSLVLQLEDPPSTTADASPSDWLVSELSY
jgi:hypothetical protein